MLPAAPDPGVEDPTLLELMAEPLLVPAYIPLISPNQPGVCTCAWAMPVHMRAPRAPTAKALHKVVIVPPNPKPDGNLAIHRCAKKRLRPVSNRRHSQLPNGRPKVLPATSAHSGHSSVATERCHCRVALLPATKERQHVNNSQTVH